MAPRSNSAIISADDLVNLVEAQLVEDQAEDIVIIDLRGKSSIADHLVIATGNSSRHVGALAEHTSRKIKDATGLNVAVEGASAGDWVLLDGGDIVVHLFRPEVRAFYNIEKMWGITPPALREGQQPFLPVESGY